MAQDQGHTFRPMTSNRTRCDVCGRTAGVPTHVKPPKGAALSAIRAWDQVQSARYNETKLTETELRALWGDR